MLIDTAKTLLLPASVYEAGTEAEYLRFNGMLLADGETCVASLPLKVFGYKEEIIAIMAVPKEVLEAGVRPVSPLLELVDAAAKSGLKRSVNIWLSANNAYLTVWENGLQMAEVFPDNSLDSILYYMQVIGRRFNLRKFEIRVGGANSALAAHTLRGYFKRVGLVDFGM